MKRVSRSHRLSLLTGTALAAFLPVAAHAQAAFTPVDGLDAVGTVGYAISADGSTVVGATYLSAVSAYYWNFTDGMTGLESLLSGTPGDCASAANAVNVDGSVIVGYSISNTADYSAVRWENGVIEELVNAYGGDSEATGVSGDGSVIVGIRDNAGTNEAFIWTEGTGSMAALTGVIGASTAYAVSADGVFVGGSSDVGGRQTAMRWSSVGGLETLGTIDNFAGSSYVYALNADGSVATGYSQSADGNRAFRWVDGEGMASLGALAPTAQSYGQAISANGDVITGFSLDGGVKTAFRWTQPDGMISLADILASNNIDITGWTLDQARGLSADGTLIVGTGTFGGVEQAFIMTSTVLVSPEDLANSLVPTGTSGAQAQGMVGGFVSDLFFTARNILSTYFGGTGIASAPKNRSLYAANVTDTMTDALPAAGRTKPRYAAYATGSLGFGEFDDFSNDMFGGTTGVLVSLDRNLAVGVGLVGNEANQDTQLGGDVRTRALGGSVIGAYEPDSGLRLYVSAAAARLDVDTTRAYLNGATVNVSSGETSGMGYALAGRAGYEFSLTDSTKLMPYGELEWSRTRLDAYTETGGSIPAAVGEQTSRRLVSRLGTEASMALSEDTTARLRGAWGHRLSGDNGSVFVTALGLGQTISAAQSKDDWAEAGASISHDFSKTMTLGAAVDGRFAGSSESNASFTLSLIYRLN